MKSTKHMRAVARVRISGIVLAVAAAFSSPAARAQDYPGKPIRFVVASQAGGVVDIRARRFGARLAEHLKQPVVVENKPGASNTIGAEFVAKSAPDGYTALFGGNNEMVAAALGMPLRFDVMRDFTPVAQFTLGYPVMVVNSAMGIRTLPALLDWARQRPGELMCGTAGHGTVQHFSCELLARSAKVKLRVVPYKSSAAMLLDIASGQIHFGIGYIPELDKQYVQTGKASVVGVLAPKRVARYPDAPTMAEMGHQGFELLSWVGLFVPAGTPAAAIQRLNAEVTKVVREPEFSAWLTDTGSEVVTPTPEQFAEFYRNEFAKWKRMSEEFGIRADPQ